MDWPATHAQLLEDWQIYRARLRRLAEEGLVPREALGTVLELTRPRISLTETSLRQIAEKLRQEAIESLERSGGEVRRSGRTTTIWLNRPVKAYVAYDGNKLHLVENIDEGDLPVNGQERGRELEKRVIETIERGEAEVYPADMDERLLYEVELSPEAAKLLGAEKVPLALMLNLGWLLSDDERNKVAHETARPGQASVRIIHWLAMAEWAARHGIATARPAVFKLSVYRVTQTQEGPSPAVMIRHIGVTYEAVKAAYERFGMQLGDPERVKQRGYAVLKTLRETAFERRGRAYAVRHVGAWLAFAAALKTLVLGDGDVSLTRLGVSVSRGLASALAGAVDGTVSGGQVYLHEAVVRLLPPLLPTLFERDVALYRHLALLVRGLEVEVGGRRWVLSRDGHGHFKAEGEGAAELVKALRSVIGEMPYTSNRLRLSEGRALRLVEMGLAKLLSEPEYEAARGVVLKPVRKNRRRTVNGYGSPQAELEALAEAAALARYISFGETREKRQDRVYVKEYAYLYYDDEEKLQKALQALAKIGYKPATDRNAKRILIRKREYIEALKKLKQDNQSLFSLSNPNHHKTGGRTGRPTPQGPQPCPFDLARAPPLSAIYLVLKILAACFEFSGHSPHLLRVRRSLSPSRGDCLAGVWELGSPLLQHLGHLEVRFPVWFASAECRSLG